LVTERGIAINPRRQDLIDKLKHSKLPIMPIEDLLHIAYDFTGIPKSTTRDGRIIGYVRYRDGSIIDSLYQIKGV
jgi:citrate lyase subunit alpha/citrate CoA-transferase